MTLEIDETMSNEVAFEGDSKQEDIFKFAEPEEAKEEATDSDSQEDNKGEVSEAEEAEEKRVPYSRFKAVKEERDSYESTIATLEERLSKLEITRQESSSEGELTVPKEWVELYGDSDVSKRAYKIQLQREAQIEERAIEKALDKFRGEADSQEKALEQNEEIIDDGLEQLQESLGKKFSPAVEESILSIVDEFSPVGSDGKYISLFPFDKAYEIYTLRNKGAIQKTVQARNQVADLTNNGSQGEAEGQEGSFKRGWDSWREAV